VRKGDALGYEEIAQRGMRAVAGLPEDLVYAGFSLGTGPAEFLAATRPGARGVVLMHGALPIEAFDLDRWPAETPVQVHYVAEDPWVEVPEVTSLGDAVRRAGVRFEAHTYPGSGHLFADPDLPEHDPSSSDLMWRRVLEFLARTDD